MISKPTFENNIRNLRGTIPSKTGSASYTAFEVQGDTFSFQRVNTEKYWSLSIAELYDVYSCNEFINTAVVKKQTRGRVNSPSVAVLKAIGCIDSVGNRIL